MTKESPSYRPPRAPLALAEEILVTPKPGHKQYTNAQGQVRVHGSNHETSQQPFGIACHQIDDRFKTKNVKNNYAPLALPEDTFLTPKPPRKNYLKAEASSAAPLKSNGEHYEYEKIRLTEDTEILADDILTNSDSNSQRQLLIGYPPPEQTYKMKSKRKDKKANKSIKKQENSGPANKDKIKHYESNQSLNIRVSCSVLCSLLFYILYLLLTSGLIAIDIGLYFLFLNDFIRATEFSFKHLITLCSFTLFNPTKHHP